MVRGRNVVKPPSKPLPVGNPRGIIKLCPRCLKHKDHMYLIGRHIKSCSSKMWRDRDAAGHGRGQEGRQVVLVVAEDAFQVGVEEGAAAGMGHLVVNADGAIGYMGEGVGHGRGGGPADYVIQGIGRGRGRGRGPAGYVIQGIGRGNGRGQEGVVAVENADGAIGYLGEGVGRARGRGGGPAGYVIQGVGRARGRGGGPPGYMIQGVGRGNGRGIPPMGHGHH